MVAKLADKTCQPPEPSYSRHMDHTNLEELRSGRELAHCDFSYDPDYSDGAAQRIGPATDGHEANVITSVVRKVGARFGDADRIVHKPILDLDIAHAYVPSSTEGHAHLYLDVELSESDYQRLLDTLADLGIIQLGYARSLEVEGTTCARLPGLSKEEASTH